MVHARARLFQVLPNVDRSAECVDMRCGGSIRFVPMSDGITHPAAHPNSHNLSAELFNTLCLLEALLKIHLQMQLSHFCVSFLSQVCACIGTTVCERGKMGVRERGLLEIRLDLHGWIFSSFRGRCLQMPAFKLSAVLFSSFVGLAFTYDRLVVFLPREPAGMSC